MRLAWLCLTATITTVISATAHAQTVTEVRLATPSPLMATVVGRSSDVVAGVSIDHVLRVWNTRTTQLARTIDVKGRDMALLTLSFDGRRLLLGDYAGRVTIWSTETGDVEWEFSVRHYLTAAAFSRDGRLLALAAGSPVQLHDMATHQLVRELDPTLGTSAVVFSRDGASLASSDGDGIRIYDARSGKLTAKNDDFVGVPLAVEFSADGKHVLASGGDRTVFAIDATSGRTAYRSAKVSDPVFYLEASPSGSNVAAVTQNADDPQKPAPVVFANVPSMTTRTTWRAPAGILLPGTGWTADGNFRVLTQGADTLHVWSIRPGGR